MGEPVSNIDELMKSAVEQLAKMGAITDEEIPHVIKSIEYTRRTYADSPGFVNIMRLVPGISIDEVQKAGPELSEVDIRILQFALLGVKYQLRRRDREP